MGNRIGNHREATCDSRPTRRRSDRRQRRNRHASARAGALLGAATDEFAQAACHMAAAIGPLALPSHHDGDPIADNAETEQRARA
eukprot:4666963-Pyramimonas_sp.AAC.1